MSRIFNLQELTLQELSLEDLTLIREQLRDEIDDITDQRQLAKANQSEGKDFDHVWYAKSSKALRIKRRQDEKIKQQIDKFKQIEHEKNEDKKRHSFINEAKKILEPEIFELIMYKTENKDNSLESTNETLS